MLLRSWTSVWLLIPGITIGACAGGGATDTPGIPGGGNHGSSSGNGLASSSSGSSSGAASSGSYSTSSGSSSGYTPSSSGSAGDDSGGVSTGDDGGASSSGTSSGTSSGISSGASSSGTSSGSSSSGSGGGCGTAIIRGGAPTSASTATAGPYQTQSYAANASVRMTNAYDVTSAHIYYPTNATPPFAAIDVVPGFTAAESSIANWGPFLASWGFVVMTFGTSNPSTGAPDTSVLPPVRADALIDALTTIKDENTRSGSPLVGKLDLNRLAVAGWSMGGGGTLIAANAHPELHAAMGLCAWNPNGTYPMDTVPTLMFGGTADGLAGPPMPQNQYMSIPATTPKELYVVNGGPHQVANDPAGQGGNIGRIGLSWMKVFLECDDRFKQFIVAGAKPSDASEFDTTVQ
jgi:dienelactone hydrolase